MRGLVESGKTVDLTDVLKTTDVTRRHYPAQSIDFWVALSSSAGLLQESGHFPEAEAEVREMLPILDANHLAGNDLRRAQTFLWLGQALHGQKKDREAADALEKALAICKAAGPAGETGAVMLQKLLRQARSRLHAADYRIDQHKIDALGFSAGGHLSADISTHFETWLHTIGILSA